MLMSVLTEGSVVTLPSLSDRCWLSVELHGESGQGIEFMCPNSPSPSAAHLSPSESFQGKVSDQQAHCLWAQSSIQLSVRDYVRMRQALSFLNGGGLGN